MLIRFSNSVSIHLGEFASVIILGILIKPVFLLLVHSIVANIHVLAPPVSLVAFCILVTVKSKIAAPGFTHIIDLEFLVIRWDFLIFSFMEFFGLIGLAPSISYFFYRIIKLLSAVVAVILQSCHLPIQIL